jgi:hypothetical protein
MTINEAVKKAKDNLPHGVSVHVYIERGFAYVYTKWPETGAVRNIDMFERLTIEEQLELAVDIAGSGSASVASPPKKPVFLLRDAVTKKTLMNAGPFETVEAADSFRRWFNEKVENTELEVFQISDEVAQ